MDDARPGMVAGLSLRQVLPEAQFVGVDDLSIAGVAESSADVRPGFLFAVIRGARAYGGDFIREAQARGAVAVLVDGQQLHLDLPQVIVPHVRAAYSRVCASLAGVEPHQLRVIGVTGTNGKTTSTWLVRSILQAAGQLCGVLGTIEYHDGVLGEEATLTTPSTGEFWRWMQKMSQRHTRWAAVELSSHALHQQRVAGLQLAAAVVTNVTHDHLDYHGSFDDYWIAKSQILELLPREGVAVLNRDDAGSWQMRTRLAASQPLLSFALEHSADLVAENLELTLSGMRFQLRTPWGSRECGSPFIGRHNVSNLLGAAAAGLSCGLSLDEVVSGFESLAGVPGRLERIDAGQPFSVFVDYAHTDDALSRVLASLRPLTPGRLICVFGAGGDRDREKRPKLGRAALAADVAIVTSDNPRSEAPERIAAEVIAGMEAAPRPPIVELDRAAAIRLALATATHGDCVLIAGKGHERVQIMGDRRELFDDAAVVRRELIEGLRRPGSGSLRHSA